MLSSPPVPPETSARPLEQNERDFTAVMCPLSTKAHFALSCCKKKSKFGSILNHMNVSHFQSIVGSSQQIIITTTDGF